MNTPEPILSLEELEVLCRCGTCAAANAIEATGVRLRNEGYTDGSVRSIYPELPCVAGYAVTVKVRTASPPTAGPLYKESTEWWDEILRVSGPRIVVIEDLDEHPGAGALVGEVHANILAAMDCVGVVTNGAVRDLPAVRELGFALIAGRVAVSHAYAHLVEMGTPVNVGGLNIKSGDLLLADCHGALSVPGLCAGKIAGAVEEMRHGELRIIEMCRQKPFSVEAVRSAIASLRRPHGVAEGKGV